MTPYIAGDDDFEAKLGIMYSGKELESKTARHKRYRLKEKESSWVAIRFDPVLLDKFHRVLRNCGSKKKAIVAVARKLSLRLRRILLTGEPYVSGVVE